MYGRLPAFQSGKLQKFVDHCGHALGVIENACQEILRRVSIVQSAVLQGLGHGSDSSQRTAKLVGHVADELSACGFDLPQPGHVLEGQQNAFVTAV